MRIKEAFALFENIPKLGRKGILTIKQQRTSAFCAGVVCVVRWYDQAPGMKQTSLAFFVCLYLTKSTIIKTDAQWDISEQQKL